MEMKSVHLVLMPGLDGSGKMFQPFLEKLPIDCKVTVVTYPGDRHIPFEDIAGYVSEQLPRNEPLLLIGESYSGPVAVALSGCEELDVRGLVLVATFARFPATLMKTISRLLPLSFLFSLPIPGFLIGHYCFGKWTTPELVKLARESVRSNKASVIARRSRSGASIDVSDKLGSMSSPCLYIRASHDRLVPARALQDFVSKVPQLERTEIEGPHCLLQVKPGECLSAISYFINNISPAD